MRTAFLLLLMVGGEFLAAAPEPQSVAVLYNTSVPDSRKLALHYCEQRQVPRENLVGLPMPEMADITREQYVESIRDPLCKEFDRRGWWRRARQDDGNLIPVANEIRVLVTCKGVPLRITGGHSAPEKGKVSKPAGGAQGPFAGHHEASVDSELALFGVDGLPSEGVLANKYYRSFDRVGAANLPFQVLTARLDAADYPTCERMVSEAVAAGRSGLWGMAYVDIAHKFPEGDGWLESIVAQNRMVGIPTVVEKSGGTYPSNYPMSGASLYYGWYSEHLDGPFRNPNFRFAPGAVAIHIHSFSAVQLTDPTRNWSAGLLAKGAAVTVGNVFEPYLGTSHHLDILHHRLLDGFSWVEACWMAMPVCSWQGVVLGDPLYEPFAHLDGKGMILNDQKSFRALRAAMEQWPGDEKARHEQLALAASQTGDGVFWEVIGLEEASQGRDAVAGKAFRKAAGLYGQPADRLRQQLHLAAVERAGGRREQAQAVLRRAVDEFAGIPEVEAAKVWLQAEGGFLPGG